jgi:hypothetical protein
VKHKKTGKGVKVAMDRRILKADRVIRIFAGNEFVPKARSLADERLAERLRRAVNRENAPDGLAVAVRSIFRQRGGGDG